MSAGAALNNASEARPTAEGFFDAPYENVTPSKPQRSRSITTMHHTVSHSNAESLHRNDYRHSHVFRTPQSSTAYKCKTAIDANFLSFAQKVSRSRLRPAEHFF